MEEGRRKGNPLFSLSTRTRPTKIGTPWFQSTPMFMLQICPKLGSEVARFQKGLQWGIWGILAEEELGFNEAF